MNLGEVSLSGDERAPVLRDLGVNVHLNTITVGDIYCTAVISVQRLGWEGKTLPHIHCTESTYENVCVGGF